MPAESVETYASRVIAAFERAKPIGEAIAKSRADLARLVDEESKKPGFYEWLDSLPTVTVKPWWPFAMPYDTLAGVPIPPRPEST